MSDNNDLATALIEASKPSRSEVLASYLIYAVLLVIQAAALRVAVGIFTDQTIGFGVAVLLVAGVNLTLSKIR